MAGQHETRALTEFLIGLRRSEGATSSTSKLNLPQAQALLGIDSVRELAGILNLEPAVAARRVLQYSAKQLPADLEIIVDIALYLELHEQYPVSPEALKTLKEVTITPRRKCLRENWKALLSNAYQLNKLEITHLDPPADGRLRNALEPEAFEVLATAVLKLSQSDIDVIAGKSNATGATLKAQDIPEGRRPRLLVVGAAVMDIYFRLPSQGIPGPNKSVQALDFDTQPGGKGLTQAVAASRMGFDVSIAAALGDDHNGNVIVKYLSKEGINTDLITRSRGSTPVTGVIGFEEGHSIAIGWKNEDYVRLEPQDVASGAIFGRLRSSDFVLMSFELPVRTINEALKTVMRLEPKPTLIVTPAPPYPARVLSTAYFKAIDLLVANEWELRQLRPDLDETVDLQTVAREMALSGVAHVCVPVTGQCFLFKHDGEETAVPAWPVLVHDATGERDALCAALAHQIHKDGKLLGQSQLKWATAAMAASSAVPGVADSMPTPDDVEDLIRRFGGVIGDID